MRSLEHVGVDEDVVPTQGSEILSDVADSAHVGRELVHIPDASNTLLAIFRNPKVLNEELVGWARLIFRFLDIDAPYPKALGFQEFHKVVADETTRPGHQNSPVIAIGFRLHLITFGSTSKLVGGHESDAR